LRKNAGETASFGNPIEIPELDELHAMAVAGFEHFEECEGRGEARVQTGWTRKVRLLDWTSSARIGKYSNAFSITMQPIMLLPQINPRYDLPKLTKEEWDEYKRIRPKALVGPDDR
jgi:hypothetical protein